MQKNKQELEILRHKVEHFQTSGGGSGDSYTKAQTNALLSAKADKSDTYTKAQTNSAISSAIGDIFADDPIELVYDEETGKIYFPTDKLDILRLHKPFMLRQMGQRRVWYCTCDDTDYGWVYFTVNTSNNEFEMSELYYMCIFEETKEVQIDYGGAVTRSEDLTAAIIPKGTIATGGIATANWYLDRVTSNLRIEFTATANISIGGSLIEFDDGRILPWNKFQTNLICVKSSGANKSLVMLDIDLNPSGCISKITAGEAISSGDSIYIVASCTVNTRRVVFDNV